MKHPVGLSAGCPPRRSLFQIPLEKFDAVPSFLWAFWVLFGLPGHFLLLTFVRADLGKRAMLWVDTGLQEPHGTQKWRKLAGLQGRAPRQGSTFYPEATGPAALGDSSTRQAVTWPGLALRTNDSRDTPSGMGRVCASEEELPVRNLIRTFRFDVLSPEIREDKVFPRMTAWK